MAPAVANQKINTPLATLGFGPAFDFDVAPSWRPTVAQWDAEYGVGGTIPSSFREAPAHALVQVADRLSLNSKRVLDLGAGNGRNAIYLASRGATVNALDFSRSALSRLSQKRAELNIPESAIETSEHDIFNGLPFDMESMDIVLDSYCLCHFTRASANEAQAEVHRVLRRGGILVKLHIDINDAYYKAKKISSDGGGFISLDEANGIYKRHFDSSDYLTQVKETGNYKHLYTTNVNFIDSVAGALYMRSIFATLLQKT